LPDVDDLSTIICTWPLLGFGELGVSLLDDSGTKLVFDSEAVRGIATGWIHCTFMRPAILTILYGIEGWSSICPGQGCRYTDRYSRNADSLLARKIYPLARENLGVATLTEVPWCSGGNIVIWNHTRGDPQHEKAAVALTQFLNNHPNQLTWALGYWYACSIGCARRDLSDGHPLREAVFLAVDRGLPYMSVPLWRRVEHQLAMALGEILDEARQHPEKEPSKIVRDSLEPLARRLNLAFSS
jgi:hypothetical protein